MKLKDRVYGCLIGAAYGDAMGAPTETRTQDQIFEKFNGYVNTFLDSPDDVFARGNKAGVITDDFSMSYVTINEILKNKGKINSEVAKNSLIEWSKNETYFEQFVGPTSRAGINRLKNDEEEPEQIIVNDNLKGSNGAAMKMGPIVLFAKDNIDMAREIAEVIAKPTHFNNKSMAGAMAVASCVSHNLSNEATIDSLIKHGYEGAIYGEKLGHQLAGPSVSKRIKLAVSIAQKSKDLNSAMRSLSDIIGTNASAYETVPTAFGLIASVPHKPLEAIHAAVNIGNDTDTIAAIIGGIVGSFWGPKMFPEESIELLNKANSFNLEKLAEKIIEYMEVTNVEK